jgi:hypothetical protein
VRILSLLPVLALVACQPGAAPVADESTGECSGAACDDTDDTDDTDGTDDTDQEETYLGGFPKDSCSADIEGEGYAEGEVMENLVRMDQFGEMVSLHDFCDHVVWLVFAAFW